jgi:hypothetical protein
MRLLFGWLAVLLGSVSIALAARYGYRGADTVVDGTISAVVFGAIALCACLFDAAAVRLYFMGHRIGCVVVGIIAAAALVVTFTNSLGAIAGRADATQAARAKVTADTAADRAKLQRLETERGRLEFKPATDEDVQAARDAVLAAERVRAAECDKRGPRCRERETEEQGKRDVLGATLANKALTGQAAKLEAEIAEVRERLSKAQLVQNPNSLGAVLEPIVGATAAALTAWQQAVVAAVFDLCLLGVMVVYELLGHGAPALAPGRSGWWGRWQGATNGNEPAQSLQPAQSERKAPQTATKAKKRGSVRAFIDECVAPADGERVEMKALLQDYRAWCGEKNVQPVALVAFLEDIEVVCGKIGVQIVNEADRVFCLGMKIEDARGTRH